VKACLDVAYDDHDAVTACVLFEDWAAAAPSSEVLVTTSGVEAYEPGAFFKRELPCLLAAVRGLDTVDTIVIDGYVWLGAKRPGLGARLYEALDARVPVIGVAKTAFHGNDAAVPLVRGESKRPLFVTAVGLDVQTASRRIQAMHGSHRIPTLLSYADRLCRSKCSRA